LLALLLAVLLSRVLPLGDRSGPGGRRVGHAQVGTEHVDHCLAPVGAVLSEGLERVQGSKADRGLVVTELLDRPGVQFSLVGTVLLDLVLPVRAVCDD
jgi:hypothetical protein